MAEITELKVDYDEVKAALDTLWAAVSVFETANGSAFSTDCGNMEAMNSDFVDAFARALEGVPNVIKSQVMSELNFFWCYANEAMERLQAADEAHSTERVEESNG